MPELNHFDSLAAPTDEPLVIHQHGSMPGRALIILVHGLGGSRYHTWTSHGDPAKAGLPKFLYDDVPGLDVGLYAYRTLFGRLKFWKSIPLKREAQVLADRIRDQSTIYRTIVLAGHSMGGILAKAALCELIKRNDLGTLASVRALLLMAAPQAGSLRTPGFLWRFSEDGRVLKAHGDLVTEIQRLFTDRVVADPHPAQPTGIVIPAFVVAGAEDNWVDQFSAGLNVHSSRMNNIRGSHTSAVKPRTKTDDGYKWVRDRIRDIVTRSVTQSSADTPGAIRAARGEDDRIVVVRVHRAFFSGRPEECHFINVTNLSPTRVVEITHVWYEDENHHIPVVQVSRLLPARLDLDASWETWIESSALPREHRQDASSRFRVRISTGRVFCAEANTSVPPMGSVPGGMADKGRTDLKP